MNGYSRSPKIMKGALIKLSEDFFGPIPNIIAFQYNPENFTRTLMSSQGKKGSKTDQEESTSEPFEPGESFDLTLELDAADALEEPESHPVAFISGVADRIAALEMLLYPIEESLLGGLLPSVFGAGDALPRGQVPIVLFAWGPGRILPVRITSFQVEEQAFSPTLYPIRAKVTVGLTVLTDDSFKKPEKKLSTSEEIAIKAYQWTRAQKEGLARANMTNTVESILDLLPF